MEFPWVAMTFWFLIFALNKFPFNYVLNPISCSMFYVSLGHFEFLLNGIICNLLFIILIGECCDVHKEGKPSFPNKFLYYMLEKGILFLGIWYGLTLIVNMIGGRGGKDNPTNCEKYGINKVHVHEESNLLQTFSLEIGRVCRWARGTLGHEVT